MVKKSDVTIPVEFWKPDTGGPCPADLLGLYFEASRDGRCYKLARRHAGGEGLEVVGMVRGGYVELNDFPAGDGYNLGAFMERQIGEDGNHVSLSAPLCTVSEYHSGFWPRDDVLGETTPASTFVLKLDPREPLYRAARRVLANRLFRGARYSDDTFEGSARKVYESTGFSMSGGSAKVELYKLPLLMDAFLGSGGSGFRSEAYRDAVAKPEGVSQGSAPGAGRQSVEKSPAPAQRTGSGHPREGLARISVTSTGPLVRTTLNLSHGPPADRAGYKTRLLIEGRNDYVIRHSLDAIGGFVGLKEAV